MPTKRMPVIPGLVLAFVTLSCTTTFAASAV